MSSLTDRVLARDFTVTLDVRKAGPSVESSLVPLASHPDEDVRELALHCLAETGGPLALEAFVRALQDPAAMARAAAMRHLQARASAVEAGVARLLIDAYDASQDPVVRGHVALVLGEAPAGPAVALELRHRWYRERAPEAWEGCVVALARLGDPDARGAFVAALHQSSGRERGRLLEHGFYIDDAWLLKPLRPILDDPSPVVRIGVDGIAFMPEYLRACDLAVALIGAISRRAFSFRIDRKTNYSTGQIDEVRAFVERLR